MALLRLGHFVTSPAGTGEMVTSYATLAAAVKDAFPGLIDMQVANSGDLTWTDVWRWGLTRQRRRRRCRHARIPEAGAAFSPAKGITIKYPEVVDA